MTSPLLRPLNPDRAVGTKLERGVDAASPYDLVPASHSNRTGYLVRTMKRRERRAPLALGLSLLLFALPAAWAQPADEF